MTKEIIVEPAPENFVVRQNSAVLNEQLQELNEGDYVVKFARGKEELSKREIKRLALWLECLASITMAGLTTINLAG